MAVNARTTPRGWLAPVLEHPLNVGRIWWPKALPQNYHSQSFVDIIGGRNAVLENTPVWKPSNRGYGALGFTSASDQYAVNKSMPSMLYPITLMVVFNATTLANSTLLGLGYGTDDNNAFKIRLISTGAVRAQIINPSGGASDSATSTGLVTIGTWHIAVATFTGGTTTLNIYLDNLVPVSATGTLTISACTYASLAARVGVTISDYCSCQIESASIWNYVLSPAQVAALVDEELAGCPNTLYSPRQRLIQYAPVQTTPSGFNPWAIANGELAGGMCPGAF